MPEGRQESPEVQQWTLWASKARFDAEKAREKALESMETRPRVAIWRTHQALALETLAIWCLDRAELLRRGPEDEPQDHEVQQQDFWVLQMEEEVARAKQKALESVETRSHRTIEEAVWYTLQAMALDALVAWRHEEVELLRGGPKGGRQPQNVVEREAAWSKEKARESMATRPRPNIEDAIWYALQVLALDALAAWFRDEAERPAGGDDATQ